jgi:hypothetical protein
MGGPAIEQSEIFEAVIVPYLVYVVNDLFRGEGTAEVLGHYKTVLEDVAETVTHFCEWMLGRNLHVDVASHVLRPATFPVGT